MLDTKREIMQTITHEYTYGATLQRKRFVSF